MKPRQTLPQFALCPFIKIVAKDIEKRRHTGKNEIGQKKKVLLKKRQKRDKETTFWTTPGARPLAKTPVLGRMDSGDGGTDSLEARMRRERML